MMIQPIDMHGLLEEMRQQTDLIKLGGGKRYIDKEHKKNKLTARERIDFLKDDHTEFTEIAIYAGFDMYAEQGGCPSGGTVGGLIYVSGRLCVVLANDQTVKSGAWFPITGKKNLRLQEIALENRLPIIYLVDSAGVFLPLQNEIFADKEHFGRVFRNNAKMNALGIVQIAAVLGACVAGGAYLPIMSDETLMVKNSGSIFLAGPYLVKAAVGEDVDAETLGGAHTHNAISGVADYQFDTEQACLNYLKKMMGTIAPAKLFGFNKIPAAAPQKNETELNQLAPINPNKPYNILEIIERIADDSVIDEFKQAYGKTIVCGYARIGGWAVGIVANQRLIQKNSQREMQIGGVIYNDSADKAARFIMNCNQKKIPLVFLQDVTGFMVGTRSEHAGIIKDGAKLVNAVANSVVPKITIIIGNSFGAGNYAMCGKAFDPRFIYAWPTAKIAVMGGEQAAKTLMQIKTESLKKQNKILTQPEQEQLHDAIKTSYTQQTSPAYAAARLWVDEIIEPARTRHYIIQAIEAANHNPIMEDFKTGVFQV